MKKILLMTLTGLTLIAPLAMARDDVAAFSIADALSLEQAKEKLGTKVAFYFGEPVSYTHLTLPTIYSV